MYQVNYWGSKPNMNDDCVTGEEFPTLEAALICYDGAVPSDWTENVAWVELVGPGAKLEKRNPGYKPDTTPDDVWDNEWRQQRRMLGGCDNA